MRRARVTGTLLSAIGLLGSSAVCNRRHCRSSPCGSWSPIPVLVGLLARQLSYAARHDGPASFGTGHRCEIKCQALQVLGGGELQLGWIVGVGMVGSILMRFVVGTSIDRYGPRQIWLASLALVTASLLGHLLVRTVDGPAIYVTRIACQTHP